MWSRCCRCWLRGEGLSRSLSDGFRQLGETRIVRWEHLYNVTDVTTRREVQDARTDDDKQWLLAERENCIGNSQSFTWVKWDSNLNGGGASLDATSESVYSCLWLIVRWSPVSFWNLHVRAKVLCRVWLVIAEVRGRWGSASTDPTWQWTKVRTGSECFLGRRGRTGRELMRVK